MNILIVTQYFWPENFRINDLVVGLIERGNEVTVLTGSPNYPNGKFYDGYGFINREQNYHGAKVFRVPLIPRGSGGGFRLALNYLSFAVAASVMGPLFCKGNFDLIFVYEPSPITVGIPALLLRIIKSAPIMLWVQDLWPESLSATGAVKSKTILSIVEKLVRFIYRRCDRILIQSRSFLDSIVKLGSDPNQILYFPNSVESIFRVIDSPGDIHSLPNGFKLMFAGNIGAAQDFQTIISAADQLKEIDNIHWVVVGDGRMRNWAESEVRQRGLYNNFHFLGMHPLEAMPAYFSTADSLLVTLKKEPIFALTIPSKIQAYLACGRPVIAALDGEGARVVNDAGAGFTCPTEDPTALAQVVLKMSRLSRNEREKMGASGRKYYEENFDRDVLLDKLDLWMKELVNTTRP